MRTKTKSTRAIRTIKKKNLKKVQNSNDMLEGVFGGGIFGSYSALSSAIPMGATNQYNPVSLNRILLSYAYMTYGIVQTFIDQPVEDAFRGGIDIETDELDEDDIDMLQDVLIECKDYATIKNVMKWARLFGGSGLIINTDQDPMEELDMDLINENSPLSFIDADRWELVLNFLTEERNPVPYNYYGQPIHKTRVVKILGKDAPSFIRRRLQGWGMSELERVVRDLNSYNKNQDVIYELLDEAKIDIWRLSMFNNQLLSQGSMEKVRQRIEMTTGVKNYHNAIVMDKEDEYEQKQLSFGGLAEIQNQNRIGIAASVRMPMTKLFGMSASGFNSGEDDIENYNSIVESEVRAKAREVLHTVVKLRCQQLFGFIPEHFELKFKPLRILNAEQEENVKAQKFQRASAMYAQGVLTPKEYMELLKKENVMIMNTEVGDGSREPEVPQASSLDIDMPQKVVKTKSEVGRD